MISQIKKQGNDEEKPKNYSHAYIEFFINNVKYALLYQQYKRFIMCSSLASNNALFKIVPYNCSDIKANDCKILEMLRAIFVQFSLQLLRSKLLTPSGIS